PVQYRSRIERTEQGEQLAPETGEAGQPKRSNRGESEHPAQPRQPLVEPAAQLRERRGVMSVLDGAGQEEQQASDQAVRDIGEQGTVDADSGQRRDAEQDEAHVPK